MYAEAKEDNSCGDLGHRVSRAIERLPRDAVSRGRSGGRLPVFERVETKAALTGSSGDLSSPTRQFGQNPAAE